MAKRIDLYLASKSPRRSAYLKQLEVNFQLLDFFLEETLDRDLAISAAVEDLAKRKALAGYEVAKANLKEQGKDVDVPVLASDTLVALDGMTMGKPKDKSEAAAMLHQLSGRTHDVITAIAIYDPRKEDGERYISSLSVTQVTFISLTPHQIQTYCQTGEPLDKAGSYAIQGLGQAVVSSIHGCYSGVVGLPLFKLVKLLDRVGIPHALSARHANL